MSTAAVTNTFVNLTTADATQVNENFNNLVTFLNSNVVHRDGSRELAADLDAGGFRIRNAAAPTVATDLARKLEVDAVAADVDAVTNSLAGYQSGFLAGTTNSVGQITLTFPTPFTDTPIVVATCLESSAAFPRTVHITFVSATSCTFRVYSAGSQLVSSAVTVYWHATGVV